MQQNSKKQNYITPKITKVEFKVEVGAGGSEDKSFSTAPENTTDNADNDLDAYVERSFGTNGSFF